MEIDGKLKMGKGKREKGGGKGHEEGNAIYRLDERRSNPAITSS